LGVTTYGAVQSFTTTSNVTVTTLPATSVTSSAATLNGSTNPNGATGAVSFCYSTLSSLSNCAGATLIGATPSNVSGSTTTPVSANLVGIAAGTTFYYQVKVLTSSGSTYGAVLSFTTAATPTVTTTAATSVASSGATLNGTVNPNGDPNTTASFCYSTSSTLTNCGGATSVAATPASPSGTSAVAEASSVTGLSSGTTYYYQAVATNSLGVTTYGSVLSFSTTTAPSVTTLPVNTITNSGATLNGSVNPNGSTSSTGFCYSTSSALTNCTSATTLSATPSSV
jgi:hypothetical protein